MFFPLATRPRGGAAIPHAWASGWHWLCQCLCHSRTIPFPEPTALPIVLLVRPELRIAEVLGTGKASGTLRKP